MTSPARRLGLAALCAAGCQLGAALEADVADGRPTLMRRSSSSVTEAVANLIPPSSILENFTLPKTTTANPRLVLDYHVEEAQKRVDEIRTASRQILSFAKTVSHVGPHVDVPVVDSVPEARPLFPTAPAWFPFDGNTTNQTLDTLFVVLSSASTKDTNLKWALDTWGARVPKDNLVVISNSISQDATHLQHESDCPIGWHWTGECCRWSEAAIVAHRLMKASGGKLRWAFFVHDAAYVRPWAMGAVLKGLQPTVENGGMVLGDFACSTSACQSGLCEGGGMAANDHALENMIANNEHAFLENHMHKCGECGRWPTLGLTQMAAAAGVEMRGFGGTYPWRLTKECFDGTLEHNSKLPYGPLMYNGMSSEFQTKFLERLFEPTQAPPTTVFPYPDEHRRCATYQTNFQCLHGSVLDTPWDTTLEFQNCSLVD